jgi:pimeloyl-ACP methyl ester carboxylesterase
MAVVEREGSPITAFDRRKLLIGMLALAAGCSGARERKPPLDDLYGGDLHGELPPLIVIPGAFGSRLLDTRSGREVWPGSSAKLLFSSYKGLEVEIDEATLDPVVGTIRPYGVFRQGLGRDFYGQILNTLKGAGGYRRRRPGDPVEPGQRNFYVYLYDWRLDNVAAVEQLHELIERIRADYGDPRLRVDMLAHSNGGLLARYYARYGTVDHLDTGDATPSYAGVAAIRHLLLVGTPNLGSMQPVLSHVRGEEMGLRKVPAEIVATTSGAPQMMPHPAIPWLLDHNGNIIVRDVFDMETWREFGWSVFDPKVRERTIWRKGGGTAGRRYLEILEAYLAKHLTRGRNFMLLMSRETTRRDVQPFVFGGDCDATVARLVVEEVRGKKVARERPKAVSNPLPGINYQDLIHDPGDSVVTRSSLLGQYHDQLLPGFDGIPPLRIFHSMFLCEQHQFLTGNLTFQNNLLHTLLNVKSRRVQESHSAPKSSLLPL